MRHHQPFRPGMFARKRRDPRRKFYTDADRFLFRVIDFRDRINDIPVVWYSLEDDAARPPSRVDGRGDAA